MTNLGRIFDEASIQVPVRGQIRGAHVQPRPIEQPSNPPPILRPAPQTLNQHGTCADDGAATSHFGTV